MAFEGLLGWTAAVVCQAQRASTALQQRLAVHPARRPDQVRASVLTQRLATQSFQTERHLFCIAAHKLLEYRQWVKRLGFLDDALFDELDKFADDIEVMRNTNEHVIEYFEGPGLRPHDWVYHGEGYSSDASSTFETKIGGRLDWVALGSAAQRLFTKISPMGPFYSLNRQMPAGGAD
jgi:hypothetical protein